MPVWPAKEPRPRRARNGLRCARLEDVPALHALISYYAAQGLLLPRAEEEIRTKLNHFLVLRENGRLLGCLALEPYGADLAEIRSLAVEECARGRGLGARILEFALAEAARRGFARVFAVTHAPEFFEQHGFTRIPRTALEEKIERDCCGCAKQQTCTLAAVLATVLPERGTLPVLQPSA